MIVTGSSGFIGSHMCALLSEVCPAGAFCGVDLMPAREGTPYPTDVADIEILPQLQAVAERADTVFHFAAKAEVVIPFAEVPGLNATNVLGTINVLKAFDPRRLVFASSSAVYGNGPQPDVDTRWANVNPLGTYGMSKAMAELACGDWARQTGRTAIAFRLGNVIGPKCRGLIPHLVRHAQQHPDGAVPVRMRGEGRITRDYVPVGHVADIFHRASLRDWPPGSASAFNIGTSRGMTNGQIAAIVSEVLRSAGYHLRADPRDPLEPGEADHVVLNVDATTRTFELPPPSAESVRESIAAAVLSWLRTN